MEPPSPSRPSIYTPWLSTTLQPPQLTDTGDLPPRASPLGFVHREAAHAKRGAARGTSDNEGNR